MTPKRPRCPWCGKPFNPHVRRYAGPNRFCSRTCAKAAYRDQIRRIIASGYYHKDEANRP